MRNQRIEDKSKLILQSRPLELEEEDHDDILPQPLSYGYMGWYAPDFNQTDLLSEFKGESLKNYPVPGQEDLINYQDFD
jgi:hypothetical protein